MDRPPKLHADNLSKYYALLVFAVLIIVAVLSFLDLRWPTWTHSLTSGAQSQAYPSGMADNRSRRLPYTDPYGNPWPTTAGYLHNSPVLNNTGGSKITVDNRDSRSAVHGLLIDENQVPRVAVRQFYIPARQEFTLANLTPSKYRLRFHDFGTGEVWETTNALTLAIEHHGNRVLYGEYRFNLKSHVGNTLRRDISWKSFNGQ